MAVKEENRRIDGFITTEAGVESGFAPSLIAPNQLSWAVNITSRDGYPHPRPGWVWRELSFLDSEGQPDPVARAAFEDGLFQGAGTYIADGAPGITAGGQPYLAVSIDGRVWTIKVSSANKPFVVGELTSSTYRNQPTQPHAWFCQAGRILVVQNGIDRPLFWNGSGVSRSNCLTSEPHQVPIGGPMAFVKNRLAVASGYSYSMGDLMGSDLTLGRDNVVNWTENDFLNEGGYFTVATSPITGLSAAANLDTSLGFGDLNVFTESDIYAFDAPIDRTVWKNLTYPLQRYAALNFGATSHESIVLMNGDMAFRSPDGIRTLQYSRRNWNDWGQTPISRQVRRALRYDTRALLAYASAVNFDNRLLVTVQPQQAQRTRYPDGERGKGVYHRGLVALDYHLVSGIGEKRPPAWEGVWTGLKILRVLTIGKGATQRCFVFALSSDQRICLWEITRENLFDFDGGDDVPIEWIMESRSLGFTKPGSKKQLQTSEVWYDQVAGNVLLTLKYRPDLEECWYPFGALEDCAKYRNCDGQIQCGYATTLDVPYYNGQARSRQGWPQPPDVADTQRGGFTTQGFEFQFRFEGSGYMRVKRFLGVCCDVQELQNPNLDKALCPTAEESKECSVDACPGVECCDPNDYGYSSYGTT